jgi:uncharacterized protein YndB with AHSA1/START domain
MPHAASRDVDDSDPAQGGNRMGTFRLTVDIRRPPVEVFAFIAEPRNMPQWYSAVDHVTQTTDGANGTNGTNGTNGIGARYHVTRSLPSGRVTNDVEVTEHEHDRVVTLESRAGPTPFRYRYEVQPSGAGTRLALDGQISGAGLPGPVARVDPLATQLFKRGMRQNLDKLRQVVEAS